jgi:hypothetical protein
LCRTETRKEAETASFKGFRPSVISVRVFLLSGKSGKRREMWARKSPGEERLARRSRSSRTDSEGENEFEFEDDYD